MVLDTLAYMLYRAFESNIRRILVSNEIVDDLDDVGAAPTTSYFST